MRERTEIGRLLQPQFFLGLLPGNAGAILSRVFGGKQVAETLEIFHSFAKMHKFGGQFAQARFLGLLH